MHQSVCNMSKCILETRSATLCCGSLIIVSFTHHTYVGPVVNIRGIHVSSGLQPKKKVPAGRLPKARSQLIFCSSPLAVNAPIVKMADLILITLTVSRPCIALCTISELAWALATLACLKLLYAVLSQIDVFMNLSLFAIPVLLLQRLQC